MWHLDLVKITGKLVRIRRVRIGLKRRSISSIWVAIGSPKEIRHSAREPV